MQEKPASPSPPNPSPTTFRPNRMTGSPTAQLPLGNSNILTTLSQSLAFHGSAHTFITSLISDAHQHQHQHQHQPQTRQPQPQRQPPRRDRPTPILRASLIGRNVAVVSSYAIAQEILAAGTTDDALDSARCIRPAPSTTARSETRSSFAVEPAYHDLLATWFPSPNLLLSEGNAHAQCRRVWAERLALRPHAAQFATREHTAALLAGLGDGETLDLYKFVKKLVWGLVLKTFLGGPAEEEEGGNGGGGDGEGGVRMSAKELREVRGLQETMFRGSVSMFPVSISTPFYKSARSKGFDARAKLLRTLRGFVEKKRAAGADGYVSVDQEVQHTLLFTSALVVKCTASLLTAVLMNLFMARPNQIERGITPEGVEDGKPQRQSSTLATLLRRSPDPSHRRRLLASILSETERLSPPLIGVLRRVTEHIHIDETMVTDDGDGSGGPGSGRLTLIPAGWDVWLYFVNANRDPSVYRRPHTFDHTRFLGSNVGSRTSDSTEARDEARTALSFGFGPKTCLGKSIVRSIVEGVAETFLESETSLEGQIEDEGLKIWLGWRDRVEEMHELDLAGEMGKDLKQLPVQRPRRPVVVKVRKGDV